MTPEFWQEKWQKNKIGFNQAKPNPLLIKHLPALNLREGSSILVPLCGKSIDMVWLASQRFEVKGIELIETAVQEFYQENEIPFSITQHPKNPEIKIYEGAYPLNGIKSTEGPSSSITIWVADIFQLTAEDIGLVDAIYDRAALVALPDEDAESDASLRVRYTQQLNKLAPNAEQLLLSFGLSGVDESEYAKYSGPPFLIPNAKIYDYYQQAYQITLLESYETQRVNSEGHPWLNLAWKLTPRL